MWIDVDIWYSLIKSSLLFQCQNPHLCGLDSPNNACFSTTLKWHQLDFLPSHIFVMCLKNSTGSPWITTFRVFPGPNMSQLTCHVCGVSPGPRPIRPILRAWGPRRTTPLLHIGVVFWIATSEAEEFLMINKMVFLRVLPYVCSIFF